MAYVTTKVKKWGNSFGVVIPKATVKKLNIKENDPVKIDIVKHEKVNGFGIAKGKGPFSRKDPDDIHEVGS